MLFGTKVWNSIDEKHRKIIWRCNEKYNVKGEKGCNNKHIYDNVLYRVFIKAFNAIVDNKDYFKGNWRKGLESENPLIRYKSKQFLEMIEKAKTIDKFDEDILFKIVERFTVYDGKKVIVCLVDETEIEVVIE